MKVVREQLFGDIDFNKIIVDPDVKEQVYC